MEIHRNLKSDDGFTSLMRFMSFNKLLDFLITGSFHFTRLCDFEDKSEAISQRQLAKHFNHDLEFKPSYKKELNYKTRQKRYFANCWFSSVRESIGMWSIYSDRTSVALKIDYHDFMKLWSEENIEVKKNRNWISHIYINKVFYKNFLSSEDIMRFKDETKIIGFQKDVSYAHEKEVRALIKCHGILDHEKFEDHKVQFIKMNFKNLSGLSLQLIFHPLMNDWEKNNLKTLIDKYEYKNISCIDSEVTPLLKGLEN
jgi:hypothetical protein